MTFNIVFGEVRGSTYQVDLSPKPGTQSQTYYPAPPTNGVFEVIAPTGHKVPGLIRKFLPPSLDMGIVMHRAGYTQLASPLRQPHLTGNLSAVL